MADAKSGQKTKPTDQGDKQANAMGNGNPFPSWIRGSAAKAHGVQRRAAERHEDKKDPEQMNDLISRITDRKPSSKKYGVEIAATVAAKPTLGPKNSIEGRSILRRKYFDAKIKGTNLGGA